MQLNVTQYEANKIVLTQAMLKLVLGALLVVFAASCSTTRQQAHSDWPASLPERSHYVALYDMDKENQAVQSRDDYLRWVKRFYRGWALSPYSWDWMVKNALEQASSKDKRLSLIHISEPTRR